MKKVAELPTDDGVDLKGLARNYTPEQRPILLLVGSYYSGWYGGQGQTRKYTRTDTLFR